MTGAEGCFQFDPRTLSLLGLAFDQTMAELTEENTPLGIPAKAIRDIVACQIFLSARAGERDPDRLRQAALAAVAMKGASAEPKAA